MALLALHFLVIAALVVRVLLRPHRDPSARVAWIALILALPYVGAVAYILFGEVTIGRRRARRVRQVETSLPPFPMIPNPLDGERPDPVVAGLFAVGKTSGGMPPVGGNRAILTEGSAEAIDAMVADVDAATRSVHVLFYIWLADSSGTKMAEALARAARRGVVCRVMVDAIGSRALAKSPLWGMMEAAGVRLKTVLPVGNPLSRLSKGRIDIRNHRKILVVDGWITYCGSQNCADAAFLPKARFAPWVDIMLRFEGPVARQNEFVFAGDWMAESHDDLRPMLARPLEIPAGGFAAQVVATGPTGRWSAAPELFETLLYAARREVVITTPYYVPADSTQAAIRAAANRGVATTLILPARNDSRAVGAASRSYYAELLSAGVAIHEFAGGLLHAKTLTVDRRISLVGSANLDRRSFDLNYENTILLVDEAVTGAIRARQDAYLADSREVTLLEVAAWPWPRRLYHNTLGVLGPLL